MAILYTYDSLQDYYEQQPNLTKVFATFEQARQMGNYLIGEDECYTFDISLL